MTTGWFDRLHTALNARGWKPSILQTRSGRLLITEHNARLFAIEIDGLDHNALWHDPTHENPKSNAALIGGDRLWIAPEVAYYWDSLELARQDPGGNARNPPQVDPGHYTTTHTTDQTLSYHATVELTDSRVDKSIRFEVQRSFRVAQSLPTLPPEVRCLSFALDNQLTLTAGDDGALAGGWSISQLPTGGTLHCPTHGRATSVTSYYDPFQDRVEIDDTGVRFRIDGQAKVKMGLPAETTTGRMGYYRETGSGAVLLLRAFPTLPGEPYVDVPIAAPADQRYGTDVLQAYNHDGGPNTFGEMEYHDPAIIVGTQPQSRSGTSVTHALFGPVDQIKAVGETFLGMKLRLI
ncbi:MAG: hypothetical protein RIG82_11785 [Phycisphaeraceae bacterium]